MHASTVSGNAAGNGAFVLCIRHVHSACTSGPNHPPRTSFTVAFSIFLGAGQQGITSRPEPEGGHTSREVIRQASSTPGAIATDRFCAVRQRLRSFSQTHIGLSHGSLGWLSPWPERIPLPTHDGRLTTCYAW